MASTGRECLLACELAEEADAAVFRGRENARREKGDVPDVPMKNAVLDHSFDAIESDLAGLVRMIVVAALEDRPFDNAAAKGRWARLLAQEFGEGARP